MSKKFFTFLIGAVFAAAAFAAPIPADQMIQTTTDQMRGLIQQHHDAYRKDSAQFYKVVDQLLVPHFDLKYIAQIILARSWRTASDDQRTRFQLAFKNMLVHNYADELLDNYDSVQVSYKPARIDDDKINATVDSEITRPGGKPPIDISFKVHLVGDQWQIFDVLVENVSLVLNFRTQVASEIKRTSLDDVIVRMEKGELITTPAVEDNKTSQPPAARSAG